jgi:hypothetical protein
MDADLNISDIIRQLIAVVDVGVNDLREEHIHNLTPINHVSTGPSPPPHPTFGGTPLFICYMPLSHQTGKKVG